MVRQAGFVDLEKRLVGDMPKCDCLERITVLLDFALLWPELERAVCPSIPPETVQPCNCSPRRATGCVVAQLQQGEGVSLAGNCGTPEQPIPRRTPAVPLFHCCKRVRGCAAWLCQLGALGRAGPNSKNTADSGMPFST